MTMHATIKIGGENPSIFAHKDDKQHVKRFLSGTKVRIIDRDDNDENWVFVLVRVGVEGWMPRRFLGPAIEITFDRIAEAEFVDSCIREELALTTGGMAVIGGAAEYLIAVALLESGLDGPVAGGSDRIGPYRIDKASWDPVANTVKLTKDDRSNSGLQVTVAAAIGLRDAELFTARANPSATPAPDGPVVVTYLNLFHAWLFGVDTALDIDAENASGGGGPVAAVIARHHGQRTQALLALRSNYLFDDGVDIRVSGFVERTSRALGEALTKAGALILKHRPEFVLQPQGGEAPWLATAIIEENLWQRDGLTEINPQGRGRILSYFQSTDFHPTKVVHWCGAFVAHCLANCGNGQAQASVVSGAARARNWVAWGDAALALRSPETWPEGAVVTLGPVEAGTSGHVGFFVKPIPSSEKIILLGGNQSDRVIRKKFDLSRVVAVRWLGALRRDEASEVEDIRISRGEASTETATPDDLLTMARTLYGEARGEPEQGIRAVACVIINRLRSRRYPDTITGVCRQPAQFSCWNVGDPNRKKIAKLDADADDAIKACMKIAEQAVAGTVRDEINGALHFFANREPPWARHVKTSDRVKIGKHTFLRNVDS